MSEEGIRPAAVSVTDLHVHLGAGPVLNGVSFRVRDGETLALLGANGSGKTTLVKTLLGLLPVAAGQVKLYGADIAARRSVPWARIGYVPQRVSANPAIAVTAEEVVASGLLTDRRLVPGRHRRERVLEALDQVSLRERARESVATFSGGQQQRVLIARALVRRPDLLVIDEPMSGIDRESQNALAATLSGLQDGGASIVVVLHDLGVLAPMIQRAVVLDRGHLVHDGEPPSQLPGPECVPEGHRHPSGPGWRG